MRSKYRPNTTIHYLQLLFKLHNNFFLKYYRKGTVASFYHVFYGRLWNDIVTWISPYHLSLWLEYWTIVQLKYCTDLRRIRKQNVLRVDPINFSCFLSLTRSESNKSLLFTKQILCKQYDLLFNSYPLKTLYIQVYCWIYFSNILILSKIKARRHQLYRQCIYMYI